MELDDDGESGLPYQARDPINRSAEILFAQRLGNGNGSLHTYLRSVMIEQCDGQLFAVAQELLSSDEEQLSTSWSAPCRTTCPTLANCNA